MTVKHFLDLADFDAETLKEILADSLARKKVRAGIPKGAPDADSPLAGHTLAMIFERPSTRTRLSFDVAMRQLGGTTMVLNSSDLQLGRGETIADTARVLSRYVDAIMIRTPNHADLEELAHYATVPVVNGLTGHSHPCQILGDILTFEEHRGSIRGRKIAWCGDGNNNVAASWIHAAAKFDFEFHLACPDAYAPSAELRKWAAANGARVEISTDTKAVVEGAHCVMTDTWVSMGDADGDQRKALLGPYQVTKAMMDLAADTAIFMHCLPAYRGQEVTEEVLDGRQSVVFDEAENRVHAQKGVLHWCLS